jgi:hypothetical protein
MAYLHSHKVVHADIHGVRTAYLNLSRHAIDLCQGNVLVDAERHAKITDFGLVVIGENTAGNMTMSHYAAQAGHIRYAAPERISPQTQDQRRNPAVDVYAFAWICLLVRPIIPLKFRLVLLIKKSCTPDDVLSTNIQAPSRSCKTCSVATALNARTTHNVSSSLVTSFGVSSLTPGAKILSSAPTWITSMACCARSFRTIYRHQKSPLCVRRRAMLQTRRYFIPPAPIFAAEGSQLISIRSERVILGQCFYLRSFSAVPIARMQR